MAKKRKQREEDEEERGPGPVWLHPDTKKTIWGIVFIVAAAVLALAGFDAAGSAGEALYAAFESLLGWGYFVLPVSLFLIAVVFFLADRERTVGITASGGLLILLSALGLIDIVRPGQGGYLGILLGSLKNPFGDVAAVVLNVAILVIGLVIVLNTPIKVRWPRRRQPEDEEVRIVTPEPAPGEEPPQETDEAAESKARSDEEPVVTKPRLPFLPHGARTAFRPPKFENYVPPPLDLLKSSSERPTTGDLRANANIIKRTLEGFGIPVEMGEVNIGPKVTRYTLKPAEGVKLSRIVALHQDLALALAAHPIRIEAPIPGKSLVGIEVPNRSAAVVRLGSLMAYPDFQSSGSLGFCLGRDVTGEPIFANVERMPHLLIAGATGSGKSVTIHSLIVSLIYKNSPSTLQFVMIDPKRVELTIYENLPHLVSPVVTENKKAAKVFRWAIQEMEKRYDLLQGAGARDITSYNKNGGKDNPLPFLVIVVDELADLMTSYGREVEGSIVRLAQMARATGIHLVLSTQRPSVEVITGLIKANITGRIALQVASQVDSRTILDSAGAEKLLGGGDLLFASSDLSKPRRIQGAYISEDEINRVAEFIREHNEAGASTGMDFENGERPDPLPHDVFEEFQDTEEEDELYDEAVRIVREAQKASTSFLQRRLKIGYSRAARLIDLMEEHDVVGPGEGAKPREVFLGKPTPDE